MTGRSGGLTRGNVLGWLGVIVLVVATVIGVHLLIPSEAERELAMRERILERGCLVLPSDAVILEQTEGGFEDVVRSLGVRMKATDLPGVLDRMKFTGTFEPYGAVHQIVKNPHPVIALEGSDVVLANDLATSCRPGATGSSVRRQVLVDRQGEYVVVYVVLYSL